MSIKFSVKKQKNDITGNGVLKFYAKAQSSGVVNFNSICETISDRSTVTKGDVMAVLEGCIFAMKTALNSGNIVRLGDFGSFQVGIKSEGTLTEKEFTASKIKSAHINFRPGASLTNMLDNLSYQKTTTPELVVEEEGEESGTGSTSGAGTGSQAGSGTGTGTGE
jgi:predicted histone-like DNA-binding protein